jgi:sugar phosphate isomerase/epimerase
MKLALNTFVYDVAKWPAEQALRSAERFGFRYIEFSTYQSSSPDQMPTERRKEIARILRGTGIYVAQMLMVNTGELASPNPAKRGATVEYMKRCGEFMLELGGKQMLICRGGGFYEAEVPREQSWMYMIDSLHSFAEWSLSRGILIDLEVEPHVYFVTNTTEKMMKAIEDIGLPNVLANVDIGHLSILREGPSAMEKLATRLVQAHLSETNTYEHTNSILGTGVVDFKPYIDRLLQLGIEENCRRLGEPCVAGIEMGARNGYVDDPERWVRESLDYLARTLPEVTI